MFNVGFCSSHNLSHFWQCTQINVFLLRVRRHYELQHFFTLDLLWRDSSVFLDCQFSVSLPILWRAWWLYPSMMSKSSVTVTSKTFQCLSTVISCITQLSLNSAITSFKKQKNKKTTHQKTKVTHCISLTVQSSVKTEQVRRLLTSSILSRKLGSISIS